MIEENRQRIKLMQEEYDELKQLFDDRPSKEEDLRLIQKLQQLLEQREEELKRAWQELKFFKLELINRENNYNKMFNANPNIGILDPFEAKTVCAYLCRKSRRRIWEVCRRWARPRSRSSDTIIPFLLFLFQLPTESSNCSKTYFMRQYFRFFRNTRQNFEGRSWD